MYETHKFATVHTDRYGRKSDGFHSETIHVNVTHLVLLSIDPDGDEFPYFVMRAFSLHEARETVAAHKRGEIWQRLDNRSFAPMEG